MELARQSDEEILKVAIPIMDNLMAASTAIDHARHVADFTDRLKAVMSKEHFDKVCRYYQGEKGYFAEREFVAVFRRPQSIVIVWRQRFTKEEGEFVAEMIMIEKDGRYLVDHVMVY